MRLFKYYSATKWVVDSLLNFRFYFSKFNELNDPCEISISGCSIDQLNIIKFNFHDPKGSNGIFCLSERNDNLHMWTQYADGHQGIVVEFETDEDKDFFKELDKVIYNVIPPTYSASMKVKDVICSKSIDSEKENEWRAFGMNGLKEIKHSAIKSIIFGCRFPIGCSVTTNPPDDLAESLKNDRKKLEALIEIDRLFWENKMPDNVEFYKIIIEHDQYKLTCSPKFEKPDKKPTI